MIYLHFNVITCRTGSVLVSELEGNLGTPAHGPEERMWTGRLVLRGINQMRDDSTEISECILQCGIFCVMLR